MNDAMDIVEISQAFKDSECNLGDDFDVNRTYSLVDTIQRALVCEFHANTDIRVGEKGAVEGNDVFRMTVVHDLEFAKDLFANRRFGIYKNNLY